MAPPEDEPVDDDTEPDDDEEDDEAPPRVVLARVADVAPWMPAGVGKKFADRPVWFLIEDDAELVELFERIPEDPMPKGQVEAILSGLRAFAAERADDLQRALGPTDAIGVGFHVDAPLARVRASFEDDGFDVWGEIRDGAVIVVVDESEDEPE